MFFFCLDDEMKNIPNLYFMHVYFLAFGLSSYVPTQKFPGHFANNLPYNHAQIQEKNTLAHQSQMFPFYRFLCRI